MTKRTRYLAEIKARVALDSICEELTLVELSKHGVQRKIFCERNQRQLSNAAAQQLQLIRVALKTVNTKSATSRECPKSPEAV